MAQCDKNNVPTCHSRLATQALAAAQAHTHTDTHTHTHRNTHEHTVSKETISSRCKTVYQQCMSLRSTVSVSADVWSRFIHLLLIDSKGIKRKKATQKVVQALIAVYNEMTQNVTVHMKNLKSVCGANKPCRLL